MQMYANKTLGYTCANRVICAKVQIATLAGYVRIARNRRIFRNNEIVLVLVLGLDLVLK